MNKISDPNTIGNNGQTLWLNHFDRYLNNKQVQSLVSSIAVQKIVMGRKRSLLKPDDDILGNWLYI